MKTILLLIGLIFISLVANIYYYKQNQTIKDKATCYFNNQQLLLNKLRKTYDEQKRFEELKNNLKIKASCDRQEFNWNQDISHTAVIMQLQQY